MGIQGIIWLIQYSLTQHHQLVILRKSRLICTWVNLSTSHTTRVVAESGFWACIYIFYSNRSSMVVNFQGLDKYVSKHTGSQTNIQENIGGAYERIITDRVYIQKGTVGVYIREGKYIRRQRYDDSTLELPNISLVKTNFTISKIVSIRGMKTKLL